MALFEAIGPILRSCVPGNAPVRQIAPGFDRTEGPVRLGDAGCLPFRGIPNGRITRWTPGAGGALGGDVFHEVRPGVADGFRTDSDGNLRSSAADGVPCIDPAEALPGRILVPERVSNVCFGGRAKRRLFITATTSACPVVRNREGVRRP